MKPLTIFRCGPGAGARLVGLYLRTPTRFRSTYKPESKENLLADLGFKTAAAEDRRRRSRSFK